MRNTLALLALLMPALASAQSAPFDCASSAPHHAFDFWVGEWTVHDSKGNLAGHNQITRIENGCALREQWRSVQGGSGQSLNWYNPASGDWHQLWVDGGASIIDIRGGIKDGSMVLSGTITYLQSGQIAPFSGTWTPLEDGRVRQFFQQQDAGGEWQTWFDGYYRRKP
jgi:hypothetical protein